MADAYRIERLEYVGDEKTCERLEKRLCYRGKDYVLDVEEVEAWYEPVGVTVLDNQLLFLLKRISYKVIKP